MVTLILRPVPNLDKAPEQYRIDLLDGSYAVLSMMQDAVWAAIEHRKGQPGVDRGLFASPKDAVEVFRAEVTARIVKVETERLSARPAAATGASSPA